MNSPDWQQLLQQGIDQVRARRGAEALRSLQQALKIHPGSRDCNHWLGQAQRLCGNAEQAEAIFRGLLAQQPLDTDTVVALAFLLREQGRVRELETVLVDFARQPNVDSKALLQIAGMLRDNNCFHAAIEVMEAVIAKDGGQAADYFRLARLLQGTGQHEAALQAYRDTLRRDSRLGGAWLGLANLQRFTSQEQTDWQWLVNAVPDGAEAAMCLAFARGKGFDDLGLYEQAWNEFREGNRLRHLGHAWDGQAWKGLLDHMKSLPPPQHGSGPSCRKPMFIVGMLRSGTTLLEQLLNQHSGIYARGELNFVAHAWKLWQQSPASPALRHELAEQVWKHMRQDGPEGSVYIDKNPLNFRYLPFLATIMPEARIVHVRRDGRDSCLSCYMQLFQHPDSAFANDLDSLHDFYSDYLDLMDHAEQKLRLPMLTVAYEELVSNTDAILEQVLSFLELPGPVLAAFADELPQDEQRPIRTASAWQARQQIHSHSVGRWKSYHPFAADFLDRIALLDERAKVRQNRNP